MRLIKTFVTLFVLIMIWFSSGCAATATPATQTIPIAYQEPGHRSIKVVGGKESYRSRSCSTWHEDQAHRPSFATLVADAQNNLIDFVCGNKAGGMVKNHKITWVGNHNNLLCAEIRVSPELIFCTPVAT